MKSKFFQRLFNSYNLLVSRPAILAMDMLLSVFAFTTACLVVFEFDLKTHGSAFMQGLLILIGIRVLFFTYFKTYGIVVRFIGEKDLRQLIYAISAGSIVFFLAVAYWTDLFPERRFKAIILIDFLVLLTLSGGIRVGLRLLYETLHRHQSKEKDTRRPTVIFGAGEMGAMIERVLRNNKSHRYKVVGFLDDNPTLWNRQLNGVPIFPTDTFAAGELRNLNIEVVILGINHVAEERRVSFNNICLELGLEVLKMPIPEKWIAGAIEMADLHSIHLEDLLSRPPINLDKDAITQSFHNKTILVTGCAGSIGSEIIRQLLHFEPRRIIGVDQAESPLVDLTLELQDIAAFFPILGNILDEGRMEAIFERFKPDVVFHAAAYKHVPAMESFPAEAIKTNVHGTIQLAQLAARFHTERFVFILTDKAVNPTNVMGASKRLSEMFVQSMGAVASGSTRFITTRFGNVLGSNGSVIPIFKRQIERREAITVTHPDITRYFMTIPEACQLVLEAGAHGKGGEIFVFDMGQPVRILDMAEKLVRLAGLVPYLDVPITFTGLRPGEKLHEELLREDEKRIPTHHALIMRANGIVLENIAEDLRLAALIQGAHDNAPPADLIDQLCSLVPEFVPLERPKPHLLRLQTA
jgi:FlaA1/EpsC-like NDP-sugar epimerase